MKHKHLKKVFVLIFAVYLCAFINNYDLDMQFEIFNKRASHLNGDKLEVELGFEIANIYNKSRMAGYDEVSVRYVRAGSEGLWVKFCTLYYGNEKYPVDSVSIEKEMKINRIPILGFEIVNELWL